MILTPEGLSEFLVKAKANTYAGDKEFASSSRLNSKDIHFDDGDYIYIDSYFGTWHFIGQEIVYHKESPIWGMNYFGRVLSDSMPDGFVEFLKRALKRVPLEAPFRGPSVFKDDRFEYGCCWEGGLESFSGTEKILWNSEKIYRLRFNGGLLK